MKPIRSALIRVLLVAPSLLAAPLLRAESVPVASSAQVPNVQLTLTFSPATTLPGIPVTVRILVTNDSSKRVELPSHMVMRATREDGETFDVGGPQSQIGIALLGESFVAPRSSTLLEVEVEGASLQPFSWFDDGRLNMPGRFRLQAILGTVAGEFPDVPEWALRSNNATLDIVEPEGVDLTVWKEMLVVGKGRWAPWMITSMEGREFARRVVTELPQSTYAGWFAASGPWQPTHESAVLLRGWLAQAKPDEFTSWREYRLAILEEVAARQWSRISPEEVRAHVRTSRVLLAKLARSENRKIARLAKERLAASDELDELAEFGKQRQ